MMRINMCPQSNVNVVKVNKFCLLTKCGIVDTFQQSWKCFNHLFSNQRFFILKELYYHRPQTKMYSIWKKEESLKNESFFLGIILWFMLIWFRARPVNPKRRFLFNSTTQHANYKVILYLSSNVAMDTLYTVRLRWKVMSTTHDPIVWISQESAEKRWNRNCCASKLIWCQSLC